MSSRLAGSLSRSFSIERAPTVSRWITALITGLSFLLALLFGGIVLFLAGENPLQVYGAMFSGAFGDWNGVAETLVKTTPLLLAGLGVSVVFRM
jgi:general nucleoside transport system permease protein